MDARTPATHIPGYSRARLKRMIAAGNVAALGVGFWIILFPTHLYALALSFCVLLPLWALGSRPRHACERRARVRSAAPRPLSTLARHNSHVACACARRARGHRS